MADSKRMIKALGAMGSPSLQRAVSDSFRMMGIAEEAIEESGLTREQQRETGVFLACKPNDLVHSNVAYDVIRAHYREICARAKLGESLNTATSAEALMQLSAQSLKSPLNREAIHAMADLAYGILGPKYAEELRAEPRPETGYEAEQVAEIRAEAIKAATRNAGRAGIA